MRLPVDLRKALRSFRFAGAGIASLFRYENNARIHLLAAGLVVVAGFWLGLSRVEWCIILTQIGLVWTAEAFNTALEKLADLVSPTYHPTIKAVKDLAAAGVLLVAVVAAVVGTLIFLPKLIDLFQVP